VIAQSERDIVAIEVGCKPCWERFVLVEAEEIAWRWVAGHLSRWTDWVP
jgi:hypothetical protein